ncbi:hypothetical protein HCH_04143 [Hahella chejuensis KCTC 2396]|uniref:Uncharacterized protein n=1 Tax=Hahella chejuensis (strain KCTC 2396) TaxID=349521 RepID=Q2SES1_HAHCH|nr:hypothetical protein HCH_04143 [Hahella chejuensis KCTC 2396]
MGAGQRLYVRSGGTLRISACSCLLQLLAMPDASERSRRFKTSSRASIHKSEPEILIAPYRDYIYS